jgi:hypothetical protein
LLDIDFASKKLQKQLNEEKEMLKAFGRPRAKRIKTVMTALRAAPNLGVFAPSYSPPHRCHELTGKRKGVLSVDLEPVPTNHPADEHPASAAAGRRIGLAPHYRHQDFRY